MADIDMNERNGNHSWAAPSIEGWVIIVTGLNEEATEEDLSDFFADFGDVTNINMPLNRRTGYVMGYALVEYKKKEEAEKAIAETDGTTFLEQTIHTNFAFSEAPQSNDRRRGDRARETSPRR
ncbi:uncharacterized protein L203_100784 [Cryptococcus depauperatus CBS 7841]|uniref:Uncharacterized protein n=1 Tax=Cryptococcus depauperatus CBS 7841 TaxID=1295531 RepID=A0A1E3J020_9TREE|nr:RNA-binding protein 8A [Cryptococcus depauperatus CBS 7841]